MESSQQQTQISHKNSTLQSPLLEIDRVFDAPVEKVFEAFKTSEAIKAWWWPNNLRAEKAEVDFRVGGKFWANMKGDSPASGGGMVGTFEEIVPNKRLVMTDNFADENGNKISAKEAKMPGEWPETCYCTFDFSSIGVNKSRLHLSQEGIPAEMQKDCIQGWNEMFDKLDKYLSNQTH